MFTSIEQNINLLVLQIHMWNRGLLFRKYHEIVGLEITIHHPLEISLEYHSKGIYSSTSWLNHPSISPNPLGQCWVSRFKWPWIVDSRFPIPDSFVWPQDMQHVTLRAPVRFVSGHSSRRKVGRSEPSPQITGLFMIIGRTDTSIRCRFSAHLFIFTFNMRFSLTKSA